MTLLKCICSINKHHIFTTLCQKIRVLDYFLIKTDVSGRFQQEFSSEVFKISQLSRVNNKHTDGLMKVTMVE